MGDIGVLSVVLNVVGSIGALWAMQSLTTEAGVATKQAAVKLLHRASLAAAAILMMYNAAYTISSATSPRPIDVAAEAVVLIVLFVTMARIAIAHRAPEQRHVQQRPRPQIMR